MPDPGRPDDTANRRHYERPAIADLGTLQELTQGSSGPDQDIVNVQAGQFPSA